MSQQKRAFFIAGLSVLLGILACVGSATINNISIVDMPQFICPSSTPRATHTQPPTQVQPVTNIPPSGYATFTPVPGCSWNGSFCATNTPYPGGIYSTPGYSVPGPTSTSRATLTPWPTPTPHTITGGFHLGADVYAGGFDSSVSIRLQIDNVRVYPVDDAQQVVVWDVEIENVGSVDYFALPGAQVFVAAVSTQSGQWWASEEAANATGIVLQPELMDVLEVLPGDFYQLTLTAFTPLGDPTRLGWILDPASDGRDGDMIGGNVAYWVSETDPSCIGNIAPGSTPGTPVGPRPTHTPTHTPEYPTWCAWCREVPA